MTSLLGLAPKDVKVPSMVQVVTNLVLLTVMLVYVTRTLGTVNAHQDIMG